LVAVAGYYALPRGEVVQPIVLCAVNAVAAAAALARPPASPARRGLSGSRSARR